MRQFLLLALGLLTACSSSFRVEAKVAAASAPVAGAVVAMDCPEVIKNSGPSVLGTTDASGRLVMEEPALGRWIHDGCELIVTKDGYQTKRVPVEAACREYHANHCTRAVLVANLTP